MPNELSYFCKMPIRAIILLSIFLTLSFSGKGQNIDWEQSFNIPDDQSIVGLCNTDTGYLAFGQSRDLVEFSEILKIDTLGQLMWRKTLFNNPSISRSYSEDIVMVHNEDNYYISGTFLENGNNDFIFKINSNGDTLWTYIYNPFGIYQSTRKLLTLKDKSVLSAGFQQQAITQEDVLVRRLDSTGNLIWQRIYALPGNQRGFDIAEMLDGSLVVSGSSDGDNLIMRIGFNGGLIDSAIIPTFSGDVVFQDINVLYDNGVGLGVVSRVGSSTNFGQLIVLDTGLNIRNNQAFDQGVYIGPYLLEDSSYLLNLFESNDSLSVVNINSNTLSSNWSISYGQVPSAIRVVDDWESIGQDLIVAGYDDTGSNQDYWLAKISGVGEEWVPDRCAYQPPRAGFDYEYNYPVLTLRDTSSGGLKYLDTVYTWQWNTSVGTNGTDDSLVVFFDTAFTKTIDIELVIGNWYGCTDTVNQTLVLGETGLEVYKELEVKVFPNPVNDFLNVEIENSGDFVFRLYDLQGRGLVEKLLENKHTKISMSSLPRGLYFYEIGSRLGAPIAIGRGKIVKQ